MVLSFIAPQVTEAMSLSICFYFVNDIICRIQQLVRLRDVWGDAETIVAIMPTLLSAISIFIAALNCVLQADEVHSDNVNVRGELYDRSEIFQIKVMIDAIEGQWKMVKNTAAVIVLDKYAERGCYFTKLYAS